MIDRIGCDSICSVVARMHLPPFHMQAILQRLFIVVAQVYRAVMEALPWTDLLQPNQSFSVEARVRSCTNLTNSQLLVVRTKDAICDYIRDRRWVRHGYLTAAA